MPRMTLTLERKELLASNIKRFVENDGRYLKDIAEEVGVSPTQLTAWMNGKATPLFRNFFALGESLGGELDSFFMTEEEWDVVLYDRQ